jgi:hypothetical protein
VPDGLGPGEVPIVLTTSKGTSDPFPFAVTTGEPTRRVVLQSLAPGSGAAGTLISIQGRGFGSVLEDLEVTLGDVPVAPLKVEGGVFTPGVTSFHLRLEAIGGTYAVYLNGSATPIASVISDRFRSGQVSLYSYGPQTYDNVKLDEYARLTLSAPNLRAPDRFECRVTGSPGTAFEIEGSADLATWTSVLKSALTDTTTTVTLPVTPFQAQQFYRARMR